MCIYVRVEIRVNVRCLLSILFWEGPLIQSRGWPASTSRPYLPVLLCLASYAGAEELNPWLLFVSLLVFVYQLVF